jgi:hypothetical protein
MIVAGAARTLDLGRPTALLVGGQARPVAEEPGTIYRCRCARSCVMSSICPAAKPSNR